MQPQYRYDVGVLDPDTGNPSLIVEVRNKLPEDVNLWKEQMAKYMIDVSCHYGFLVTPEKMLLLRDNFKTMDENSIEIYAELQTQKILGESKFVDERDLEMAVRNWLDNLIRDWNSALPSEPKVIELFIPELVTAVSGGNIVFEYNSNTK